MNCTCALQGISSCVMRRNRCSLHDLLQTSGKIALSSSAAWLRNVTGSSGYSSIHFTQAYDRVRYFWGKVPNSGKGRKNYFLASNWLKFGTLPQKYRTLLNSLRERTTVCQTRQIWLAWSSLVKKSTFSRSSSSNHIILQITSYLEELIEEKINMT